MTTPNQIADAARTALLTVTPNLASRLTATQFKAVCSTAVSLMGLTKGAEVEGLASAVRAEERALCNAHRAVATAGMVEGWAGKASLRLTADGSSVRLSVPWSRQGSDSETIQAAKAVLARPVPDAKASEGTRAQYFARQRHATATLCRLDADFALADAERGLEAAAAHHERMEAIAIAKQRAQEAATAGQPVTPEQVAKAKAKQLATVNA